jgi:hypothetical protein
MSAEKTIAPDGQRHGADPPRFFYFLLNGKIQMVRV